MATTDIPTEFWGFYINSPEYDRNKKLDPISENIIKMLDCKFKTDKEDDMKFKKKLLNSLLSSYFDDLISYTKNKNRKGELKW